MCHTLKARLGESMRDVQQVKRDASLQLSTKQLAVDAAAKQLHDVERQRDELKARLAIGIPVYIYS